MPLLLLSKSAVVDFVITIIMNLINIGEMLDYGENLKN